MNKNKYFIVLSVLVIVATVFYFINFNNSKIQVLTLGSDLLLWKKEGYMISIPSSSSTIITVSVDGRNIQNGETQKIYNQTALGHKMRQFITNFEKEGFALDKNNSSDLGDFYYIQSFYKNDKYCSLILNGQSYLAGNNQERSFDLNYKCASDLNHYFAEQKPYLDLLGLKDSEFAVSSIKKIGDFTSVSLSSIDIGGPYYILKEQGVNMNIIDGPLNEYPQCKKMEEWKVPKEIYEECYDVN